MYHLQQCTSRSTYSSQCTSLFRLSALWAWAFSCLHAAAKPLWAGGPMTPISGHWLKGSPAAAAVFVSCRCGLLAGLLAALHLISMHVAACGDVIYIYLPIWIEACWMSAPRW